MRTLTPLVLLTLLAPAARADRAPTPVAPTAPRAAAPAPSAKPGAPAQARPQLAPPAPVVQLAPIDPAAVPERCQPLAKQAVAPNLPAALSARISLASCMAEQSVAQLSLCDCGESIVAVDAAVAPAIAVLDDVIEKADPATQIIAEHAQGELYTSLANRMLGTLPKLAAAAPPAELALNDLRRKTLDAQLAPWREASVTAHTHVVELATAHPDVAARPVVSAAVRDSQQRVAAEVATREADPRPATPEHPTNEEDPDAGPTRGTGAPNPEGTR